MVRAIARATVEQAKGSKQVTDAIGRIAETVQQIAAATAQQARGSELIMKSAEKMRAHHAARRAHRAGAGEGRPADHRSRSRTSPARSSELNTSHKSQADGTTQAAHLRAADRRDGARAGVRAPPAHERRRLDASLTAAVFRGRRASAVATAVTHGAAGRWPGAAAWRSMSADQVRPIADRAGPVSGCTRAEVTLQGSRRRSASGESHALLHVLAY